MRALLFFFSLLPVLASASIGGGVEGLYWRPYGSTRDSYHGGFGVWGEVSWGCDTACLSYEHLGNSYRSSRLTVGHRFKQLYGFAAARYVRVKDVNLEYTAGAPELGLGIRTCNFFGLSAFSQCSVAAAIGKQRVKNEAIHIPSQMQCLPLFSFSLGALYSISSSSLTIEGEVGYKLEYFFGVRRDDTPFEAQARIETVESNLGYGGPYIAVRVRFR